VSSYRSPKLCMIPKNFSCPIRPLANFGSFLQWMKTSPPTRQFFLKKTLVHTFEDVFLLVGFTWTNFDEHFAFVHLSIKEGNLFVCHVEISQSWCFPLHSRYHSKLLMSTNAPWVLWGGFAIWKPTYCKSFLKILNNFVIENSIKWKLKFLVELVCALGTIGKWLMIMILWR
jgi:hypothetical protein